MDERDRRPAIRDPRTHLAVDEEGWREACAVALAGDTIIVLAGSGVSPWDGMDLPPCGVVVRASPPDPDEIDRCGALPWRYGRWVAGEGGMPSRDR